jgi:hypothetical protein
MSARRPSARPAGAHARRMQKWRNLAPAKTRLLLDAVVESLVPMLESAGFQQVEFVRQDPTSPTSGKEIVLERVSEEHIDSVVFNFDKYHRPRFQVHCSRRDLKTPNDIIRSANLVRNSSQYYHFWGKAWWLPMSF